MKTNVKSYTDEQLLNRVAKIQGFNGYPEDYWVIGVQSNEDEFNKFDDKFYLFKGKEFIMVTSGTTNAGKSGLEGYDKYGLVGVAVWKTDIIYYNLFKRGLHKGKMEAYRQDKPIYYYRDKDKDQKAEQVGELKHGIIYANMHGSTYNKGSNVVKADIGGWSIACQVYNDNDAYEKFLDITEGQKYLSYALIKEF